MRKQTPSLDWQIIDDDTEWERQQTLLATEGAPPTAFSQLSQKYSWVGITLFLLLLMAGHWWWRTAQAKAQQAQAAAKVNAQQALLSRGTDLIALAATVERLPRDDLSYDASTSSVPYPSDQHSKLEDTLAVEFQTAELHGDQAVVSVTLADLTELLVYRQTRFYWRTATGWQRTPPDETLWGEKHSLETTHFVFRYRQRDATTVQSIAPQMDKLYTTLQRNFGIPSNPSPVKRIITVSVEQAQLKELPEFDKQQRLYVRSPGLYLAPVNLTNEQLLAQSIALPLLRAVIAQASERYGVSEIWHPFVEGLYLWQIWDLPLPLAAWREEVVQWQYHDLPATQPGEAIALPKDYQELCITHKLWLWSPTQIGVPLVCSDGDWENWNWGGWKASAPLTQLEQLSLPAPTSEEQRTSPAFAPSSLADHPGRKVALTTLLEYAIATYGRDRLPALVAGLGQYEDWETVIPAVYAVSATEFEAGWQEYLAAQYNVPIERARSTK